MSARWRPGAWLAVGLLAGTTGLGACTSITEQTSDPAGSPEAGRMLLRDYGCVACHQVPGVPAPQGAVGPPLAGIADRRVLAGSLPNTPEALARWIQDPQEVEPGSLMPDLGVTDEHVNDIVAYLYTLGGP